ncbi:MAG TPA: hypothetical protein VLV32_09835 [Burkholderiales bacterium]|nr:hypothetical protein [Burkholderiales bacterium]
MHRQIAKLIIFALCVGSGYAAMQEFRPPKSAFNSRWVVIVNGTTVSEEAGQLALMLMLKNKTARTLWVKVTFSSPESSQSCAIVKKLAPQDAAGYTCLQKEMVTNFDYSISITTYADKALTQNLETTETEMRFRPGNMADIKTWTTPVKMNPLRDLSSFDS